MPIDRREPIAPPTIPAGGRLFRCSPPGRRQRTHRVAHALRVGVPIHGLQAATTGGLRGAVVGEDIRPPNDNPGPGLCPQPVRTCRSRSPNITQSLPPPAGGRGDFKEPFTSGRLYNQQVFTA